MPTGQTGLEDLLAKVPLFAGLTPQHLERLAQACRRRTVRADETLFFEGDPGHTLYLIISGQVKIQRVTPSGKLVVIALRGPGEHVGEMALLDGEPRSADAVTVEQCELLMLDRDQFLRCMSEQPQIALNMLASLTRRLREAANQAEGFRELDVLGRVSAVLLELAETHGEATPAGIRITQRITQQELADRIGATRVSVNKALGRLKRVRALRSEGGDLIVTSTSELQRLCAD
jgi:CRP/FNR family cyclic AMP-dependent transcriptional regulator